MREWFRLNAIRWLQTPVLRYSEEPDSPPSDPGLRGTSDPACGGFTADWVARQGHQGAAALSPLPRTRERVPGLEFPDIPDSESAAAGSNPDRARLPCSCPAPRHDRSRRSA